MLRHLMGAPKEGGKTKGKGKGKRRQEDAADEDELPPLLEDDEVDGGPGARDKILHEKAQKKENVILKAGLAGGAMALAGAGAAALIGGGKSREDDEEDEDDEDDEDDGSDDDDDGSMVSGASFGVGGVFRGRRQGLSAAPLPADAAAAGAGADEDGGEASADPSAAEAELQAPAARAGDSSEAPSVPHMHGADRPAPAGGKPAAEGADGALSRGGERGAAVVTACVSTWMQAIVAITRGPLEELLSSQQMPPAPLGAGGAALAAAPGAGDASRGGEGPGPAGAGADAAPMEVREGPSQDGDGSGGGGEWLPRSSDARTPGEEVLLRLAHTARLLAVEFEVVQTTHDLLDMVEMRDHGGSDISLSVSPLNPPSPLLPLVTATTTSAYLQTHGKIWGELPSASPIAAEPTVSTAPVTSASAPWAAPAQGGKEAEEELLGLATSHVPSSLPVYVKIKLGDEVATSNVVWSEGLLEQGCLGGEWKFGEQEFQLDCSAPSIHFSLYLKQHDRSAPLRGPDDDPSPDTVDDEEGHAGAAVRGEGGAAGGEETGKEEEKERSEGTQQDADGVTVERLDEKDAADGPTVNREEVGRRGAGEEDAESTDGVGGNLDGGAGREEEDRRIEGKAGEGREEEEGDELLGTARVPVSQLVPARWKTPVVDFQGNPQAMLIVRIKLMKALLPMPLDDERRARRMAARAPPQDVMELPPLRSRHTTPDPQQLQLLNSLKKEILYQGGQVYNGYPASYAGISTAGVGGAHRGFASVVLDGLGTVGERVRLDLLENLAALHYLDPASRHVAPRPFDRASLQADFQLGYVRRVSDVLVGRNSELAALVDTCVNTPQAGRRRSATLVTGARGCGKTALLSALDRRLRQESAARVAVVSLFCRGFISPPKTARDIMFWLVVSLGLETGKNVLSGASSWVVGAHEVELLGRRRLQELNELGFEDLVSVWLRFLESADPPAQPMPTNSPPRKNAPRPPPSRKTVVIIDGLDVLETVDVSWLPFSLPMSVEIVLSCCDDGDTTDVPSAGERRGGVGGVATSLNSSTTSTTSSSWLSAFLKGGRVHNDRVIRLAGLR